MKTDTRKRRAREGFTLVEAAISIALVTLLFTVFVLTVRLTANYNITAVQRQKEFDAAQSAVERRSVEPQSGVLSIEYDDMATEDIEVKVYIQATDTVRLAAFEVAP